MVQGSLILALSTTASPHRHVLQFYLTGLTELVRWVKRNHRFDLRGISNDWTLWERVRQDRPRKHTPPSPSRAESYTMHLESSRYKQDWLKLLCSRSPRTYPSHQPVRALPRFTCQLGPWLPAWAEIQGQFKWSIHLFESISTCDQSNEGWNIYIFQQTIIYIIQFELRVRIVELKPIQDTLTFKSSINFKMDSIVAFSILYKNML